MMVCERKVLATVLVFWMLFAGIAAIEWNIPNAMGHIPDDSGNALQLFSYYNPQVTTDVTIDGDISQVVPYDEWDGAYVREITMSDFLVAPTTFPCFLFFQNDDDWLYIGILYQTSNSNQANSARLYFDEGNEAGRYDGSHDDTATALNENYVMSNLNGATLEDGYWDGAAWDTTDGDGLYHFDCQANSGGNYLKYEWRIPLDPKLDTGPTGSDLNIVRDDEIGFFIQLYHAGFSRDFYWDKTSDDPTDFGSYADLKLGIMTKDRSFYSTFGKNTPTIDGDITNDFGWSDCYQRDILLTNYEGTTLNATIFICQDPVLGYIYIGFIIKDDDNNANDALRLYFEEGSGAGPYANRTGALSGGEQPGGPEWEHYQQVTSQGVYEEGWFDAAGGQGIWKDDTLAGDAADDGDADANYYNPTGSMNDRYEFEFLVPYDPASPELADGIYDLWITNHDLIGMLIRFYDSDMPAGEEYFYWDITSNADKVMTSNSPDRHIAPGWAYLQTGCAWVRLVSPVGGSTVNGNDYIFRIDADDEDPGLIGDDITYVGYQIEGEVTWHSLSQGGPGSSVFQTSWDTTKYDNGVYNIRIVVQDNDGVTMWRTITITIVNPTSIAPPTGVVITSPAPGTISGTQNVVVTAMNADRVELYVDGEYVNDMAPTGNPDEYSYNLDTKNYDDGYHQFRARAINGAGESSGYETYTFDNWDDLLSVAIKQPTAGEAMSGVYTVLVDFEDDDQDNAAYPGPGYVELYVDGALTVVEYTETEWAGDNWGYEITLDTVWFPDGSHTLKTMVYDPEGNSLADTVLVNFVNEPTLQIMQPAVDEVISGSYPLTIKVTDPNGNPIMDDILNPQYRVDYGMWYDMTNTLSIGYVIISEVMYEHTTVDAEWIELFNPLDRDINLNTLSIEDDGGTIYTFGAMDIIPAYGTIVVAINEAAFQSVYGYAPDYNANMIGIDRLGDNGDFINFAAMGDYVEWEGVGWSCYASSGRSIQRSPYIDSDTESDWLSDVGTVTPGVAAPVSYMGSFDTSTLSDGPHVIEFQATDSTGAVAAGSVNVIVDNILLESIMMINPAAGEIIKNLYSVVVDPSPETEANYAELYVDDKFAAFDGVLDGSGNFEFSLLTTAYEDGFHNLKIKVYDLYDNSIVNTSSITIQNQPSLYLVSPKDGEVIRGVYEMNISAVDTDGILDDESPRPRYRIDGGTTWYDLDKVIGTSNYVSDAGEFDTTLLTEGLHTIEFEVMDNGPYGITAQTSVDVYVDNNRPTGFVVLPSSGQYIEGTYTFSVMATDNLDVDYVEFTFVDIGGSDIWNLGTKRATYNSFTGYYEFTAVTTIYSDGAARMDVDIYDKAGNANDPLSPITINFYIDNTEPTLSITDPSEDEYVTGTISYINATTSDGPYTPTVEYKIDTGSWNLTGGGPSSWSSTWDTTTYIEGEHTITVRARDALNHISLQEVTVIVDNNDPMCTILSPVQNQYVEGTVIFKVHASDTVGVEYVDLTLFGSTVTTTYNSATGYYEYTTSTAGLDGTWDVTATAYDLSGKISWHGPVTFFVDNEEPLLTIDQPFHGEYVSGDYIITATSTDAFIDKVEYRIDTTNWVMMTGPSPWTATWNTSDFSDGEHMLTIRAMDNAYHTSEQSIIVIVDNHYPSLTIRAPVVNEYIDETYTFQATSLDSVGVDYVEIEVFGLIQTMSYNHLTGYYEYTINTYPQADGTYQLNVTSYDLSGKSTTVGPRNFNVDNIAPLLLIDQPIDGEYLSENYSVNVTATDTFISEVEYKVDTTQWVAMNGPQPSWTGMWNTTKFTDGEHTLTIQARDSAGHVTEQSVNIVIDNHYPAITINTPVVDQYVDGVFTFQIAADDSPAVEYIGIDYVEITVFGSTQLATYNALTGYYEYTVSTYTISDGTYNISAVAYDLSGKFTSAGPLDFNIDNNAPILVMNDPGNGEYVEGDYTINVSVVDAFILSVEYRIDNTNWIDMNWDASDYWVTNWNTLDEVDGGHRVSVRAIDHSGKLTEQYVDIFVDNTMPTCDIVSPAQDQYIEGIFTFQIAATDAVGIDLVLVSVYDMVINATYNMQTGYYEFPLDTRLKPEDNIRNVSAITYDLSGKNASDGPISFKVDNHPPVVKIIYPENGDYISGEIYVNITAQDAFIGPQEYSIDDRGWEPIVVAWNTTEYLDGWHTLSIRVYDMIGHLTQQTINLYVDNTPPKCSIVSPVEDQYIEAIYTFEISATDLVGVDYVNITIFDMMIEVPLNSETGYYEYSVDTRTVDDGIYAINATAYDKSGKWTEALPIDFRVDNMPPDLTIVSPLNGEYVSDEIMIEVSVIDTFDYTVKYSVDDSGWVPIEEPFNTTFVSDNEHKITVRAVDEAGHITDREVTVIVDNIAPELVILEPINGTHLNGEIYINIYAGGGVQKVMLNVDGGMEFEIVRVGINDPYETTIDTMEYEDGWHTIEARSIDFTGHETFRSVDVFMDNSGPIIGLVNPYLYQRKGGTIKFEVNCTDDTGVETVYINLDNTEWKAMFLDNLTGNYTYRWKTNENDDRIHEFEIKAVDTLGNEEVIISRVKVTNNKDYWRAFQDNLPGLSAISLIIFIILLFILLKVGTLQRWYREEEKPPREGKEPGRFRRAFSRKEKTGVAGAEEAGKGKKKKSKGKKKSDIKGKNSKGVGPEKSPPKENNKSLVESIDDIEIKGDEGAGADSTPLISMKTKSNMTEEIESASVDEPDKPVEKTEPSAEKEGKVNRFRKKKD